MMKQLILILKSIYGFFRGNGGIQINVVSGPRALSNCGSAEWQVRWSLNNMGQTGWIIQHVKFVPEVTDCTGNEKTPVNSDGLEYWESWEVRNGGIWVGFATNGWAHHADTFRTANEGEGTKGKVSIIGRVRFYSNYNLTVPPWGYAVHQAGSLPTIQTRPTCWTDSGARKHELEVTWCCCPEGRFNTRTGTDTSRTDFIGVIRRLLGMIIKTVSIEKLPMNDQTFSKEVTNLIKLISEMPAWSDLFVDNKNERGNVPEFLQQIALVSTENIRQAMSAYVEISKNSEMGYDVSAMSRLYVLNRYLFNVPDKVESQKTRFGAFSGIPTEANTINELWPLSMNTNGKLILEGKFSGYFGESYLAVQEFDYFNELYGRRKMPG